MKWLKEKKRNTFPGRALGSSYKSKYGAYTLVYCRIWQYFAVSYRTTWLRITVVSLWYRIRWNTVVHSFSPVYDRAHSTWVIKWKYDVSPMRTLFMLKCISKCIYNRIWIFLRKKFCSCRFDLLSNEVYLMITLSQMHNIIRIVFFILLHR